MQTPKTQDIDVNRPLHIPQSRLKLAGFAVVFAALTVVCLVPVALIAEASVGLPPFAWFILACAALFAGTTAHFMIRVLKGHKVMITLSPQGYRDAALYDQTIPWPEVTRIKATTGRGAHLRLSLTDTMGDSLRLKGLRGVLHRLRHLSTAPVAATNPNTLTVSLARLHELTTLYAAAHGGPRNDK